MFRGAGFAEVVLLVRARIWLRAPSSDNLLSEVCREGAAVFTSS